jgi:hypothetical protein
MKKKLICIFPNNENYKIAICDCSMLDHHFVYPKSTENLEDWEVGQMMGGN